MDFLEHLSQIIDRQMREKGITQAKVAEIAFGRKGDTSLIQSVNRTKNGPTARNLKAICDALGLEFYIGPRRDDIVSRIRERFSLPEDSSADEILHTVSSQQPTSPSEDEVRSALNDALNLVFDAARSPQDGSLDLINAIHARSVELQLQAREIGDPLDAEEHVRRLKDEVLGRNIYSKDGGVDTPEA